MKVQIYEDEMYPYYGIIEYSGNVEISQELLDEFNETKRIFDATQEKLRKIYKATEGAES